MYKQKVELNKKLLFTRMLLLVLITVSFIMLVFLALLPKEPEMLKGVTYDLSYPGKSHYSQVPAEVFEKDFKLMKEAGINTIRLYGVPPEFILDLADKYGLKVIETVVFPGDWTDFSSPYQLQALKRKIVKNIRRDIDRECIYAWSIWNDAPWTYGSRRGDVIKAYGKEKVTDFLRELYETVKKEDPLRPVTAANLTVNEDAVRLGADFLDILGYNTYVGVSDWREGSYDPELAERMVDRLVDISREYKKPVIITETGYSTYWTKEFQEDVIRDQIGEVGRRLDGIILFQWADDWSKSGDVLRQNDDIEEHWGLLEGTRKPKSGYYAVKQMFRSTAFRNLTLSAADYFRGTYFAARKRALRRKWKEKIIADKDIEKLQNLLNLKPASRDVSDILRELADMFFKDNAFDQFASYLEEYGSAYKDSPYLGTVDYYIALSGWNKLEYLAKNRMWELYYAEKTRDLDKILDRLKMSEEKTKDKEEYLAVLYLEWLIHNDILAGGENAALARLEEAVKSYSARSGDANPLVKYARLLKKKGQEHTSNKLLREYTAKVEKMKDMNKSIALLKQKADEIMAGGDFTQAKILYDSYVNAVVKNRPAEDASFAILELANLYRHRALYDESIEMCELLLRDFSDSELIDDAAYIIGVALKEKKSYSKAVEAFRGFILNFSNSDLSKSAIKETLSIFSTYGRNARAKKAVPFLKEIISLYPNSNFSVMARFELASSLSSLGRAEEAMQEYKYIIENHPHSDYAKYAKRNIRHLTSE